MQNLTKINTDTAFKQAKKQAIMDMKELGTKISKRLNSTYIEKLNLSAINSMQRL
jgi:hypothetical protein